MNIINNYKPNINKLINNQIITDKLKIINIIKCYYCKGSGWTINVFKIQKINEYDICKKCLGRGYL